MEALRHRRLAKRRTIRDIADATGMSPWTVAQYEDGGCPTLIKLERWCRTLGLRLTVEPDQ